MAAPRPARVLHVIDGLAGGGSERWVYDIVRLSDQERTRHRVTTVHADLGRFVYADALRRLGAYGSGRGSRIKDSTPFESAFARSARLGRGTPFAGGLRLVWHGAAVFPAALFRTFRERWIFGPDVIHGHTFHGFVFALLLARVSRRPLVHTVPSLFSQMEDAGYGWLPALYRRHHRHVDRFFTAYPDELASVGVPAEKIHEIRGVIDLRATDAIYADRLRHRETVRGAIGIAADAPVALSVGRLHTSKGHDLAVAAIANAARLIPNLSWILLGDGDERRRLEALVDQAGIAEHAHLLGYVPNVLPYYAAADAYLRTTLFEAESQSSYQAMAMGLPVIGFATGARTELVRDVGHGLLVRKGDVPGLAQALIDVLVSQDRGATLGARGRAYAKTELGIEQTINELTEAYERLSLTRTQAGGA